MGEKAGREKSEERKGDGFPAFSLHSSLFPLPLSLATILTTGLALAASTLALQWGAAAPAPDALDRAWLYVNIALLWTTLALWPALALKPRDTIPGFRPSNKSPGITSLGPAAPNAAPAPDPFPTRTLLLDFAALFIAAIPALALSAFLSSVPLAPIAATLALQLAAAIFATGLMAWRSRIPPVIITAALVALAVILPLLAYLWAEFLPAAPQSCLALIPMLALSQSATTAPSALLWWTVALYAFLGISLLATAPRSNPRI